MSNLNELEQWDDELYQLETTDPVKGGPEGIANKQAKTLGNRTKYLRALILNAIGNDTEFAETITNALSGKVGIAELQKGAYIFATDTGAANAYICNLIPALTARGEGQVIKFKVKTANSGASTINDGVSVVPLVGGAHLALQGGELVAGGDAWVQWNSEVGTGSYVLLFCTGASTQVTDASKSKHTVNLGQFAALLSAAGGYIKIPVFDSTTSTLRYLIIQLGTVTISFNNTSVTTQTITFPITFPNGTFYVKLSQAGGVATGSGMNVSETAITPTGFNASVTTSGSTYTSQPFKYLAIGW